MNVIAHRQSTAKRRGGVLVIFAMIVFGLMAIAALVIDLGLASATQGQMQVAVDSAALEALRGRNTTMDGEPDYHEPLVILTEDSRRDRATELIGLVFDDDLNPSNGDDLGYGVGPALRMLNGIGDVDASALIVVGGMPDLDLAPIEPNAGASTSYNARAGDLVAGHYDASNLHDESSDYQRSDFVPAGGLTSSSTADAFLVRMRRTGEASVPGESWIGPRVPYLFARGSLIKGDAGTSPRKDGIAVRATAIASLQHALHVGRGRSKLPGDAWHTRGVLPFTIHRSHWNRLDIATNDPRCVELHADGTIHFEPDGEDVEIGGFVQPVTAIGETIVLSARPFAVSMLPLPYEGWVPIYDDILGTDRVIGFGYVDLEEPEFCTGDDVLQLSKRVSVAASDNASSTFPQHVEEFLLNPLSKAEWTLIFAMLKGAPSQTPPILPLSEPLLAPAISR